MNYFYSSDYSEIDSVLFDQQVREAKDFLFESCLDLGLANYNDFSQEPEKDCNYILYLYYNGYARGSDAKNP